MQVTEARLRLIVLEEVQLHLLDVYINEELDKIFEQDEPKDEDDDEVAAYKKAKRQAMFDKIKKGAMAAGVAGAVAGGIQSGVSDIETSQARTSSARQAQNIAAANTDAAQLDKFSDQLNNQYRFRWGKGSNAVVYYPGTKGKVTVLPASYSLAVKALEDKKMNAERIAQGLRPIERYGEIDLDNLRDNDRGYKGDFEQNIDNFFKTHKGNFVNALDVVGAHDELNVVPGSGTEDMIVMVDPDKISADYYLPELGMTAEAYYKSQYGYFMGSGELEALEQPDEEMIVTPDDHTTKTRVELDPRLTQKTKERAASLKESRITWKNYKNRKKKLA